MYLIIFTEIDDEDDWAISDEAADDDNDRYVLYRYILFLVKSIVYLLFFFHIVIL